MYPFPLYIWFEVGALIVSLICWLRIRDSKFQWFVFFLFAIVLIEMVGRYYRKVLHAPNTWLYNFSIPAEYLFFGFILYLSFTRKISRRIAMVFLIFYPVFVGVNLLIHGIYYLYVLNVIT